MKIIIEGHPIAKKRHKCRCINGHGMAYDPQVKDEMSGVKEKMANSWMNTAHGENKEVSMEAYKLTCAKSFEVRYTFVFSVNKSDTKAIQNSKLWGLIDHNVKPDRDNLEKFYSDCATGIIWADDAKIVFGDSKKYYGENPRTEMEIMVKEELKVSPQTEQVLLTFGPTKLREFLNDVSAFWAWPSARVDEVVASGAERNKESVLTALAQLLIEFADRHGDDLRKIKKLKEG